MPDNAEVTVISKPLFPEAASAAEVFAQAMANPVDCESLERSCDACSSACILLCDITRPVPNHVFLQPMIRTMMDNGIPARYITVLVATGLGEPHFMTGYSGGRKVIAPRVAHITRQSRAWSRRWTFSNRAGL